MLERTDDITNDILEPVTFVLAYPAVQGQNLILGHDRLLIYPLQFIMQ